MSLTLLVCLAVQAGAQGTSTFTSSDLNLTFQYPKSWTLTVAKKKDDGSSLAIPLEGGSATLLIRSAVWYKSPELWEEIQRDWAKTARQTVTRQWREVLLGVPVLLTSVTWTEKGAEKTKVSGLLYSGTTRKLLYHLTADSAQASLAEAQVREALATLRTLDGSLPQAEDAERVKDPKMLDYELKGKPVVLRAPVESKQVSLAPQQVPAKAGGLDVVLRLPEGWSAKPAAEGFVLTHPGLKGSATIAVLSTLDSDQAERALLKSTAKSLDEFTEIITREDRRIAAAKSGSKVFVVSRTGKAAGGGKAVLEAAGAKKDFYWMLRVDWPTAGAAKADAKLIESLINQASVELPG